MRNKMKKIFLDCGTHFGQGLRHMIKHKKIDSTWDVHSWEANPHTYRFLIDQSCDDIKFVNLYNSAVANFDGEIEINIETTKQKNSQNLTDFGQGSSIISIDEWDSGKHIGKFEKKEKVSCIDFSLWIQQKFLKDDFIIIKLDIEGAEYDLLEKMIHDNTIDYIDEFYIEWHSRFFKNQEEILIRESKIKKQLGDKIKEYIGPK
jgi:FkbM family methyltransferase